MSGSGLARYGVRCAAPWWARGGHAQTLFGHLLPCREAWIDAQRGWTPREVELEDGERLLVFMRAGGDGASRAGSASGTRAARATGEASGAPRIRVHLFHGLSGDVNSEYMRRAAALFARAGHDVWAVNHRGCGEGSGLATRPYHSGRTDDMQAVLAASRADAPERRHLVVGFSLSGNIALLYAGRGLAPAADAIVAINPPVDLERASRAIHAGFNRLYEARFMHRLGQAVRERERLRAARGEPGALHPDVPSRCRSASSTTATRRPKPASPTGSTTTGRARACRTSPRS